MKTYRKRYLVFLSVLLVTPISTSVVFAKSEIAKVTNADGVKTQKSVNARQKKLKAKGSITKNTQYTPQDSTLSDEGEKQKALDLSPSLIDLETNAADSRLSSPSQSGQESIFTKEKKRQRLLSLDGQVLMSQEPEADKKKSMDGAGISINLKR